MQQAEPPQRLSSELEQLDHGLKRIQRTQHPGLQRAPDSLPVLEAFQGFLEAERRKARARLVTLFVTALLMLLVVASGAVALILRTSGDLQGRVDKYVATSVTLASDVAEAREKSSHAILGFENKLANVQQELEVGLAEAIRLSEANDVPLELPAAYHEAMAELKAELRQMRETNTDLAGALQSATNEWELAATAASLAYTPVRPVHAALTDLPDALPLDDTGNRNVPPPSGTRSMTLFISPPGDASSVKWRLPAIQE
jgi:hypothetical protein